MSNDPLGIAGAKALNEGPEPFLTWLTDHHDEILLPHHAEERDLWPRYARYVVEGDFMAPAGKADEPLGLVMDYADPSPTLYPPMQTPELPFKLAAVKPFDANSALQFVNEWGLLGYEKLVPRKDVLKDDHGRDDVRDREPLAYIWFHADLIRRAIDMYRLLQTGGRLEYEHIPEIQWPSTAPIPKFFWNDGINKYTTQLSLDSPNLHTFKKLPGHIGNLVGTYWLSGIITTNLRGFTPILSGQVPGARFAIAYKWPTLRHVAYWHLAMAFSRSANIGICQECGGMFEQQDARQKYCPPASSQRTEAASGLRVRPQSQCGLRLRMRRSRAKRAGN